MASLPATNLPQVGETIAGKYRIVRLIAEGGMGVVYEAVHARLGQRFAIKVLYPHYSTNADIRARFDLEGRIASRLDGLNVARVFDIDAMPNGLAFMVLELLSGNDLETELHSKQILSVTDVADIVSQAAAGMRQAHALGVVHRDLKPANLFLTRVPGTSRQLVKVLDFGISRVMHDGKRRVTADFAQLGTALYMSPEQVRCAADVDGRTDIWALGVIMYECLTGAPPFDGQVTDVLVQVATAEIVPPRVRRPDLPQEIEAIIMRALERDVTTRFQSMDELVEALRPWVPSESVESLALRIPRPSPPTLVEEHDPVLTLARPRPRPRRKRTLTVLGVVVAGLAGLGTIIVSSVGTRASAAAVEVVAEPSPAAREVASAPITESVAPPAAPSAAPSDTAAAGNAPAASGDAPPPSPRAMRRPARPTRSAAPKPAVNPPRL